MNDKAMQVTEESILHVQEGLRILQKNGTVMKCQNSHADAIWYADVGASAAVLEAGYNMASLQHRSDAMPFSFPSFSSSQKQCRVMSRSTLLHHWWLMSQI